MSDYSDLVIADGPLHYWKFGESAGYDAVPTVGSVTGFYGNCTLGQPALAVVDPATSVYLNGYAAIQTYSNLGASIPLTVEFWIKPDQDAVIGVFDSAPNYTGVLRNYPGDQFAWWDCSVSYNFIKGTVYHVAVVFSTSGSNKVVTVYVDGVQVGTNSTAGTTVSFYNWAFGNINTGSAGYYKGWLGHMALYSKILTQPKLLQHSQIGRSNCKVTYAMPVEIPGGMGKYAHVPLFFEGEHELYSGMFGGQIEYVGWLPAESKDVPIENWHQMWLWSCDDLLWSVDLGWNARVGKLPFGAAGWLYRHRKALFDAGGITALLQEWNVLKPGVSVLPHLWNVATELTTGEIGHSWDVLTEAGGDLPHLWRVAEPKLVILHGQDIQLPYGRVETP